MVMATGLAWKKRGQIFNTIHVIHTQAPPPRRPLDDRRERIHFAVAAKPTAGLHAPSTVAAAAVTTVNGQLVFAVDQDFWRYSQNRKGMHVFTQ